MKSDFHSDKEVTSGSAINIEGVQDPISQTFAGDITIRLTHVFEINAPGEREASRPLELYVPRRTLVLYIVS